MAAARQRTTPCPVLNRPVTLAWQIDFRPARGRAVTASPTDFPPTAFQPRRTVRVASLRSLPWPVWVAFGGLLVAAGLLLLPVPRGDWPAALVAGVCPQRPGHTLFLDGRQLPLEARMLGIFGSFLAVSVVHWLAGRGLSQAFGRWWALPLALLFILVMGFDGMNAVLTDVGGPALYAPDNTVRLITGLLAGAGLSIVVSPVLAPIIWHRTDGRGVLTGWRDLPAVLLVPAAIGLAAVSGQGVWYAPLAVLAVGGVVALLAALNAIVLLVAGNRDGRIDRAGPLAGWLSVAIGLAVLELAGLAALRWWLTAALGLRWEVL